ncbi:RNA polymerase sigma factor [Emticicia sp. 21SJ11W-3]|uniref:RNA polymerase sigma factor n=1 Tax=Emticicia sp. 21SJ11W-3 TaxID=2916755 RepID=UPI00209D9117|nr:sigma-70 family RNA polymerase sigma factor [Emticicia sp. 21SJ11W-3]UTA69743.1 sigma-70 family RNA polymerase sigma factor [Emticicia sp. 21SJ11W-3]
MSEESGYEQVNQLVSHLFRHEAGKMTAVLARMFGFDRIELAEDIVQDTLMKALSEWRIKIPDSPAAWLYKVAKNQALDVIRREKLFAELSAELAYLKEPEERLGQMFMPHEIEDSQLRMLFACCHPAIALESQITLSLKTLGGLHAAEIARAFLTSEDTINKRLYRAKEKIRVEHVSLDVPVAEELTTRLDAVLKIIYLIFSEGYSSSHPNELIRKDLCEEAIRLSLLLTKNPLTNLPKTNALLALMCFQTARFPARIDVNGTIVLLKDQNRNLWDSFMISRAYEFFRQSAIGNEISEYHLEAAIASYHASAQSFEKTNWDVILRLYNMLADLKPSPFIQLNRAIVKGYVNGPAAALKDLNELESLRMNYTYQTAKGDLYAELADSVNAIHCYEKALQLVKSDPEKRLIEKKLAKIKGL